MILKFLGVSNKIITSETITKTKRQLLSISVTQQKKIAFGKVQLLHFINEDQPLHRIFINKEKK